MATVENNNNNNNHKAVSFVDKFTGQSGGKYTKHIDAIIFHDMIF